MQVRVCSPLPALSYGIAAELESRCHASVSVSLSEGSPVAQLQHRPGLPAAQVLKLIEVLKPIQIDVLEDPALTGCDAQVTVAWEEPLGENNAYIAAEHPDTLADVHDLVGVQLGFEVRSADVEFCAEATLAVDPDVATPAWQALCWLLERKGHRLRRSVDRNLAPGNLQIRIPDAAKAREEAASRIGVLIRCDDAQAAAEIKGRIRAIGLPGARIEITSFQGATGKGARFGLAGGPLVAVADASYLPRLQLMLAEFLAAHAVDAVRHPLLVSADTEWDNLGKAIITVPLQLARSGNLPAYAGPFPERFSVVIHCDDEAAGSHLQTRLAECGFRDIQRIGLNAKERLDGFKLMWGAAAKCPEVAKLLVDEISAAMVTVPAPPELSLKLDENFTDEDCDVWIYLPVQGVADGGLLAEIEAPSRFRLKLHSPEPAGWQALMDTLAPWGFEAQPADTEEVSQPKLKYGAAPARLVKRICDTVRETCGVEVVAQRSFSASDRDLWLYLPVAAARPEPAPMDLGDWLRPAPTTAQAAATPFVEVQAERARIGQTWLPRLPLPWHPFVPDAGAFVHYCIDAPTAETLSHLAQSVALREPCLLEGETSTSKTSSILYLASLLGQPVVRINLNGQTDTGELIGRYVPQNLSADLPVDMHEMHAGEDLLQPETRMIMSRVESERRRLTGLEVQQIMANEGMHAHPWRWQDGLVVQAMKKGWWLLLDEVNLAEPQILERMNSVLEQDPFLVLTEHDNSVVGWGGTPVHPGFRIFATMNPAEYAGRSVLSPAYRDRWRAYRLVPKPREAEYRAMLRRLVFGEQPGLALHGVPYRGAVEAAPFGQVADLANAAELLEALALFHAALEQAASGSANGGPRIGVRRKERQVFTRRGLLSVVGYLAGSAGQGLDVTLHLREALMRYYLNRVGEDDRAVVVQLLDAAGIGPNTWLTGA